MLYNLMNSKYPNTYIASPHVIWLLVTHMNKSSSLFLRKFKPSLPQISVYPHVISVVADANTVNLSTSGFVVSVKILSYLTIHVWLDIIQNWATKMIEIFMFFF